MWSESKIHESCYSQNYEAGKVIDETLEKARNLDFSEVHDEKEAIDQIFEKLEIRPERLVYLKDNFFFYDLDHTNEENFRNVLRLIMRNLDKEQEL